MLERHSVAIKEVKDMTEGALDSEVVGEAMIDHENDPNQQINPFPAVRFQAARIGNWCIPNLEDDSSLIPKRTRVSGGYQTN